jgi:photosystem II stability/assembly factor-like uncharacterized protein
MYGHFRRVALTACVLIGTSASTVSAREIYCRTVGQCRSPDAMAVLLRPASDEVVLDANFGTVYRSPGGAWQYTCDDIFPGRIPYRTQITADGRVFVPTMRGLFVGSDGCGFTQATGAFADKAAYDVAVDPSDPKRVWAVGGDPRTVALSTDGGMSFTAKHVFAPALQFIRVAVAPKNPQTIYVAGFNGTREPLVMGVSADGGDTWTVDETVSMGVASPDQIAEFLGVSPDDPNTVFVMVTNPMGDEIWRSTMRGQAFAKVLVLADAEEWPRGGFSFGGDGKTLFVAGFDPLNTGAQPPGSIYASHDGGGTWQRHSSGAQGPHYRCVGFRAGKLYGCGGDVLAGDQFYLGVSSDEGKTWSPMITLADIHGPNSCVADKCSMTVDFLTPFRNVDGGAPDAGAAPGDAGRKPPASVPQHSGCALGHGSADGSPALILLVIVCAARRRRGEA